MNKKLFRSILTTLRFIIFKQESIFPFWLKWYHFCSDLKLLRCTIHIISSALRTNLHSICQTINVCYTWRSIYERIFSLQTLTKHFKAEQRVSLRSDIKNSFWSWIFFEGVHDSVCLLSLIRHLLNMRHCRFMSFFSTNIICLVFFCWIIYTRSKIIHFNSKFHFYIK